MLKKIKRLFEPTLHNKKASFKEMVESAIGYINIDALPILIVPYIISLLEKKEFDFAILVCIGAFLLHIVLWFVNYLTRKWDLEAKYAMNAYVDQRYRREILLKDHKAFDVIGTGKVQSIVQKGIDDWTELNWQVIYQIPKLIVGISTGVYIMLRFDQEYVFAFFALMIVTYTVYSRYKYLKTKHSEKSNDVDDQINANSVRSIMARQEIVFSNKVDVEVENFLKLNTESKKHSLRADAKDYIANVSLEVTGPVISFIFVAFILYRSTTVDVPSLIFLIYFASRFIGLMYMTSWMISQILDRLPKIEKFWKFLDETPNLENYEKGDIFVQKNKSIDLRDVSLAYADKKVLEHFSISIPHGKKVALVGKSGSGKTTIAKLISGYMYADTGEVLIDDQNIRGLSLKSYYKHIGYLTQEPMIFDGSIRENLLYALDKSEEVQDSVLFDALRRAECDFVTNLDTQIGEKGIRLSGGERQRLAIAKLMLKNPEIIILDEPTSALDSFSEEKITKALDELFKGKTVIIIAHRLQTIKKADDILVIEEGKIIERGVHEELMSGKNTYYKMVELQSGF